MCFGTHATRVLKRLCVKSFFASFVGDGLVIDLLKSTNFETQVKISKLVLIVYMKVICSNIYIAYVDNDVVIDLLNSLALGLYEACVVMLRVYY